MAHLTMGDQRAAAPVQADTEKLDRIQNAERDAMVTRLGEQHTNPYSPKFTAAKAMAERMKRNQTREITEYRMKSLAPSLAYPLASPWQPVRP